MHVSSISDLVVIPTCPYPFCVLIPISTSWISVPSLPLPLPLSIGKEKEDGSKRAVIRPYTPSHTTVGYLELVIKEYPQGKMSKHISSLKARALHSPASP